MMETKPEKRKQPNELRRGVIVFIVLAVLTALEYELGILQAPSRYLWVIALLKAAAVIQYFMHIGRVFNPDEEA